MKLLRIWLYIIAGITFPLIGWNIGELLVTDLGLGQEAQIKEIIIFPSVSISLAIGMVVNEIFVSNPGRFKLCLRKMIVPVLMALGLGIVFGLAGGGIYQLLFYLKQEASLVRMCSWIFIGLCVGLAEGLSWSWYSIEAGNKKRFVQRLVASISSAVIASLLAAFIFEWFRRSDLIERQSLGQLDDPIGFSLLGLMVGLTFAFTNSPSYLAALRAGAGFEFKRHISTIDTGATKPIEKKPSIDHSTIQFVGKGNTTYDANDNDGLGLPLNDTYLNIQEGLSIQLPGKGQVNIGSEKNQKAQIILPGVAIHVGFIKMEGRNAYFAPNAKFYESVYINGEAFDLPEPKTLKHGSVIKICKLNEEGGINEEEFYRFVYYNRFLDPDS